MARRGERLRVVPDDVVAQAAAGEARRDADIVPAGELDRFLAADDRDHDRRMGRCTGRGQIATSL